jgi:hypothetical protein
MKKAPAVSPLVSAGLIMLSTPADLHPAEAVIRVVGAVLIGVAAGMIYNRIPPRDED